jgi:hypothetical protein
VEFVDAAGVEDEAGGEDEDELELLLLPHAASTPAQSNAAPAPAQILGVRIRLLLNRSQLGCRSIGKLTPLRERV